MLSDIDPSINELYITDRFIYRFPYVNTVNTKIYESIYTRLGRCNDGKTKTSSLMPYI